jgi:hypothetical protein
VSGKVAKRTTERKISGVKLLTHSFHVVCLGRGEGGGGGGGGEDEEEEEEEEKH